MPRRRTHITAKHLKSREDKACARLARLAQHLGPVEDLLSNLRQAFDEWDRARKARVEFSKRIGGE